jgi:hypothetical protein
MVPAKSDRSLVWDFVPSSYRLVGLSLRYVNTNGQSSGLLGETGRMPAN